MYQHIPEMIIWVKICILFVFVKTIFYFIWCRLCIVIHLTGIQTSIIKSEHSQLPILNFLTHQNFTASNVKIYKHLLTNDKISSENTKVLSSKQSYL